MAILSLHSVRIQFGGPPLLEGVSVNIDPLDRIAVTGRNGEGKSTLLKILAGRIEPDTGNLVRQPGLSVAYLSQDVPGDREGSALEVASVAEDGGEAAPRHRVEEYLLKLGVEAAAPFNTLSGGLRRRTLLAGALARAPQLLLLDEPTNHLDVERIEWLEKFLQKSRCACLFVTHDRAFLQHVATRVFDLDRGHLAGWNCDYATFLRRKADLLSDEAVFWERKEQKLNEEEAWIRRGVKARTRRNQGRVAALLKLREEFAARRGGVGLSRLDLGCAEASGERVLKLDRVSFAYPGGKELIHDFSAKILRGERIGVIGPNGSGKTTLLNLLCGRLAPTAGEVTLGAGVKIAFFDQLRAQLDVNATVLENLSENNDFVNVNGTRKHVYSYLGDFLFTSDRARTPVRALSGGERARLLLAKLFLNPGNLLVLDEPTNDLDVETLELLEEQVQGYAGTVLLVSHDRTFLDNIVTSSFVLEGDGGVHLYPGGYADWQRQRAAQAESRPAPAEGDAAKERAPAPASRRKPRLSYNEQREREQLPARIEELEAEVRELNAKLADTTFYVKDPTGATEAHARLAAVNEELETAVERWAVLEEKAESV
ncbi:MAG: ATP-binding cassette domain-containing protein [Kiritimatiellae bacterium]|nr:ATP-binding cassette domain-containing protein [Kiritimatiellia bacterium]